jgi:hypothetical protein
MSIEKKMAKQDAIRDIRDNETTVLPAMCKNKHASHRAKEYDNKMEIICKNCIGFGFYTILGHEYKCDEYKTE